MTIADRALTIYTSGTTGLPKAANVSHRRLMQWSFWFAGLMNTRPDDRMYDCLPMYHSVGGVVATGAVLVRGGSVVIREKFSATRILGRHRELGLHAVPIYRRAVPLSGQCAAASARTQASACGSCCGNGLRADIWQDFQARFEIPRILEFYAATEGNVSLYNVEGKVGAIGRVPPFLTHRFPLALVKFDAGTGEPARDADGRCIRCATDETGEAIGRIDRTTRRSRAASSKAIPDAADTERKILRDVFEPGDAWYPHRRSDAHGCAPASSISSTAIGDTFRWKGENVATSEVAAAIMAFPGVAEASVYGVARSRHRRRGRHGDACHRRRARFPELRQHLAIGCRPMRGRCSCGSGPHRCDRDVQAQEERTRARRFRSATVADPIYFDDPERQAYVRLDQALYERIGAGTIRTLADNCKNALPVRAAFYRDRHWRARL